LRGLRSWFGRIFRRRKLEEQNNRLRYVQRVQLPQAVRQVASAYQSRAQLEIDRIIYDVRDHIIQRFLGSIRSEHQKLAATITELTALQVRFTSTTAPTTGCLLQSNLVLVSDLVELLRSVASDAGMAGLPRLPSAWDLTRLSGAEIEQQLLTRCGEPLKVLLSWQIDDFLRALQRPNSTIEEALADLKTVSLPLLSGFDGNRTDYVLIRAGANSDLSRMLRALVPDARWVDNPDGSSLAVLQLECIQNIRSALSVLEEPTTVSGGVAGVRSRVTVD